MPRSYLRDCLRLLGVLGGCGEDDAANGDDEASNLADVFCDEYSGLKGSDRVHSGRVLVTAGSLPASLAVWGAQFGL